MPMQFSMLGAASSDPEPLLPPFSQLCSCLLASRSKDCDDVILTAVCSLAGSTLQDALPSLQAVIAACDGTCHADTAAAAAHEAPATAVELRDAAQGLLDTHAGASPGFQYISGDVLRTSLLLLSRVICAGIAASFLEC